MTSAARSGPTEPRVSVQLVEDLLARIRDLTAAAAENRLPVEAAIKASFVGDITAIATLATIAARSVEEQVLVVREFDLPRDRLFRAWTTPELVRRWWGAGRGEVATAEIDLRVGGAWRYVLASAAGEPDQQAFHGEFREVVPGERLVWTQAASGGRAGSVNTVMFSDLSGRTRLALLIDFDSPSARDAAIEQGLRAEVEDQLERLESVAARHG